MKDTHRSEKGQIIVLFVFGLIGLLGLTALAIDGGMIYSDRRFDQSVADSAALAGAGAAAKIISTVNSADFSCGSQAVIDGMIAAVDSAIARGEDNGFSEANKLQAWTLENHHGVDVVCSDVSTKYLEVQVELSSITNTSLIHIITGQKEVPIGVKSKVRIYGKSPFVPGAAIVGLSPYCQGNTAEPYGIEFDGTSETVVLDGGIFSNGGIYSGGANTITAESMRTIADIDVRCPDGFRGQEDNINIPEDSVLNGIEDGVEPVTIDIDQYDCAVYDPAVLDTSTDPPTWSAGRHDDLITGSVELAPGMHCLMDGLQLTGNGDELIGDGVTIYVQEGDFIIGGQGSNSVGANISAWAVGDTADPEGVDGLPGMLIYVDPDNTGALVKMIGNSASSFEGTILNQAGTIEAGGDSATPEDGAPALAVQFIGWNIKIHGGPGLAILYEEKGLFQFDAFLDQYE